MTLYDRTCTACPLHKDALTVCMPAAGTVKTRGLIVGEAPGREEDRRGIPFVGHAGQTLDRALKQAFVTERAREEIMVTNAVKCRPPANRDPSRIELDTCVALYLVEEIHQIDPIAILVCGNIALEACLGIRGISSVRGTWHLLNRDKETWVMPTWHPAYVNYNSGNVEVWREFLSDITEFANKIIVKQEVPL